MGLFQKLLSLHNGVIREEDLFTEIFVAVLRQNSELKIRFLKDFIGINDFISSAIDTQVNLQKLKGHAQSSRPDIVIQLQAEDDQYDIIFVESKIKAHEHDDQLKRYAEQLAKRYENARNRFLVYITRSYDPKEKTTITKTTGDTVHFIPILWSKFFRLLKQFQSDMLVKEMMRFMEEKGMSETTQLLPSDLLAIAAFPRLHIFMQKSLEGEIQEKFYKVLGIKPERIYGYRNIDSGRVMLWNYLNKERDWAIGIGYALGLSGQEHPLLEAFLEINPESSKWNKIAPIFKSISMRPIDQSNSWILYDYDNPDNWTHIRIDATLSSIISSSDHMQAVGDKLLWYLDQVAKIKKRYPGLPWSHK